MNKLLYLSRILPDKIYIELMYLKHFHKFADLSNPSSFNEKLQYLKLHDRNPLHTMMVDKYLVKDYVSKTIGEKYVIPTLEKWNSADEIDVSKLPNQFVLKCNNDSGGIIICKSKDDFDEKRAKKMLGLRVKNNGFWYGREWPYKNVKPCIFAEKYLENSCDSGLIDYKIHVFNGIPKFILVCQDRYSESGIKETFYSTEWKKINIKRPDCDISINDIERPDELDDMLNISRRLSNGSPFVRVDLYVVDHRIYFGELTFYPKSGFGAFEPDEWDSILGSWLDV